MYQIGLSRRTQPDADEASHRTSDDGWQNLVNGLLAAGKADDQPDDDVDQAGDDNASLRDLDELVRGRLGKRSVGDRHRGRQVAKAGAIVEGNELANAQARAGQSRDRGQARDGQPRAHVKADDQGAQHRGREHSQHVLEAKEDRLA